MSDKTDKAETKMMDPTAREATVGAPAANNARVCYAAKTLVAEVEALFPETPVEYSNYDGRNTALDVTFDLTTLDEEDRATFIALFTLFDFDADPRVDMVIPAHEDAALLVSFKSNAQTQDSRDPFGLDEAWSALTDSEAWSVLTDSEGGSDEDGSL